MNSQKAYWFALGIFVLVLNSEYQHGAFPALHRALGRAGQEMCQMVTHANQAFATARVIVRRSTIQPDDLLASADARELAESHAELLREQTQQKVELLRDQARAQADVLRTQVEVERAEMNRMRAQLNSELRFSDAANRRLVVVTPGKCPKLGAAITLSPAGDSVDDADDEF